tara:strand:+ start:187 stop:528 length:342 start_codon:yes stop_codon:yes gene_type:complete
MAALSLMGFIFILAWVAVYVYKKNSFPQFMTWLRGGYSIFPVILPLAIVTLVVLVQNYYPTVVRDSSSFGRNVLGKAGIPGPLAGTLKKLGVESDKHKMKNKTLVGKIARSSS